MLVWNASFTWLAEPENSSTVRPLVDPTWNPCDCSHDVIICMSASVGPNCAPNCSGVSHLWYWGEFLSCWSSSSLRIALSCTSLRLKTSSILSMGRVEGARLELGLGLPGGIVVGLYRLRVVCAGVQVVV